MLVAGIFITPLMYYVFKNQSKWIFIYSAFLPLVSLIFLPAALLLAVIQTLCSHKWLFSKHAYYLPLILIWMWLFYKVLGGDNDETLQLNFVGALWKRCIDLLQAPHAFVFHMITEVLNNYYWVLSPLALWIIVSNKCLSIKWLSVWFLTYPICGFSFSLFF